MPDLVGLTAPVRLGVAVVGGVPTGVGVGAEDRVADVVAEDEADIVVETDALPPLAPPPSSVTGTCGGVEKKEERIDLEDSGWHEEGYTLQLGFEPSNARFSLPR